MNPNTFNLFPLNEERLEKINEAIRNQDVQIYLYSELLTILGGKQAQSESVAAALYYKASSLANILIKAQQPK